MYKRLQEGSLRTKVAGEENGEGRFKGKNDSRVGCPKSIGQERIVVSRKGEATAVILGYEDFLRSVLRLKEPAVLRKIREAARRSGASRLTSTEIDAEIRAARQEKRKEQVS
jgi:hypothetical protein